GIVSAWAAASFGARVDFAWTGSSLKDADWGGSTCWTAVYGAITTASWLVTPDVPFCASTPATWKLAEPILIVWPSGFSPEAKRLLSTVWPTSATRLRFVTSEAVSGFPAATEYPSAGRYACVVPITEAVVLAAPYVACSLVETTGETG